MDAGRKKKLGFLAILKLTREVLSDRGYAACGRGD